MHTEKHKYESTAKAKQHAARFLSGDRFTEPGSRHEHSPDGKSRCADCGIYRRSEGNAFDIAYLVERCGKQGRTEKLEVVFPVNFLPLCEQGGYPEQDSAGKYAQIGQESRGDYSAREDEFGHRGHDAPYNI